MFDSHIIPDNEFSLFVVNQSSTLRPCTKQRNISCEHLRTKVHLVSPSIPPPPKNKLLYSPSPCPTLTAPRPSTLSNKFLMIICIMTLQHVWFIRQICEVTVWCFIFIFVVFHTVVFVEMQTDRAASVSSKSPARSSRWSFRRCELLHLLPSHQIITSNHTHGKKERHLTNMFSVTPSFLAPSFAFFFLLLLQNFVF